MRANDREDGVGLLVVAIKEVAGCSQQRLDRRKEQRAKSKELGVGHFPPEVAPEHLDRVHPGARGGQRQQHESACCPPHDGLHRVVVMRIGVVPSHLDRARSC